MTVEGIEIVPDASIQVGGHAIIRLKGLWLLPASATFRIEPIEEAGQTVALPGWPVGDLKPRDTRMTASGIELLIGPEVVDQPDLVPGTPVRLSIAAAGVDTTVRWPELPLSLHPSRGPVGMTPVTAPVASRPPPLGAHADLAQLRPREPAGSGARDVNGSELRRKMQSEFLALASGRLGSADTNAEDLSFRRAGMTAEGEGRNQPISAARALPFGPDGVANPKARGEERATVAGRIAARPAAERVVPQPASTAASTSSTAAADGATLGQQAVAATRDRASERSLGILLWPLVIGLVVTLGLTAVVGPQLVADLEGRPQGLVTQSARAPAVPSIDITAIFSQGDVSPQGISASGKDIEAALTVANRNLHGVGGPPDREEAAFWLRRAVALTLSEPRVTWAMTQLGTIYAQPPNNAAPDYHSARVLWEMSGAMGDPVALCFVGQMHEYGLGGIASNKSTARAIYEKAGQLGGCKGLDAALERVKP
ncbi:MAG: tetratricopeptide repeat protein [Hyphomicrobiaceae bacterium]|nr:tetratricopeptide repeat protein [Hyphomicrobiaceae bacterium]